METVKMMIELPKETYNMIKNFSNWNSSQVVIEDIEKAIQSSASLNECIECDDAIKQLPSVTPQEPKTGYWILTDVERSKVWHCNCSKCNKDPLDFVGGSENWWLIKTKLPKYCPNCGAKMIEPQESED